MTPRVIATAIIWTALTIVSVAMFENMNNPFGQQLSSGMVFTLTCVFVAAATISTLAIWMGNQNRSRHEQSAEYSAKAKRLQPSRIDRLIETLDDDEVYELEERLLAREQRRGAS